MESELSPNFKNYDNSHAKQESSPTSCKLHFHTLQLIHLNYVQALKHKIWRFLSAPLSSKKIALRGFKLGAVSAPLIPEVVEALVDNFSYPCDDSELFCYLERIHSPGQFDFSPVKELACFFYAQVVLRLSQGPAEQAEPSLRIILYAVCLSLAQKYLFDKPMHSNLMTKILGMPKKALYEREIFLMDFIFDFFLKAEQGNYENFRFWLYGIQSN